MLCLMFLSPIDFLFTCQRHSHVVLVECLFSSLQCNHILKRISCISFFPKQPNTFMPFFIVNVIMLFSSTLFFLDSFLIDDPQLLSLHLIVVFIHFFGVLNLFLANLFVPLVDAISWLVLHKNYFELPLIMI